MSKQPPHSSEGTRLAVQAMELAKPQIWGGDFNHTFEGKEYVAFQAGRAEIQRSPRDSD